jgi:endonuclease G
MPQFESASLRAIERLDPKLLDEVRERLGISDLQPEALKPEQLEVLRVDPFGLAGSGLTLQSMAQRPKRESVQPLGMAQLEAIILSIVRPPLLVRNGTFVPPENPVPVVAKIVATFDRLKIDPVIALTARVELVNVPNVPFVGTGWIVDKPADNRAILVTNRHVAEEFAATDGQGGHYFRTLPNFRGYEPRVDFLEEYGRPDNLEAPVLRVVFMSAGNAPDIALIEAEGEILRNLKPVEFSDMKLESGAPVGVVGYPAYDSRSDPDDVFAYFGNIFDVKRFAFGQITSVSDKLAEFTHDATTLGGNSGSCVFNRDSGKAVGLHFAGNYKVANYAVLGQEIQAALRGLKSQTVVSAQASAEARGDGRHETAYFKRRDGYDAYFLDPAQPLKPPRPGPKWADDLTNVDDADTGGKTKELKYRHFSVWMCRSRRLPLLTAVNIDGGKAKRLGRIDRWFIDGRVEDALQVDNAAYVKSPLDRGHMVRREDPVWGSVKLATQANEDTFHYPNATPQHEGLNQRDWVRLEDYILGNARTRKLKVSVFTGPVFGEDDRLYRDIVRLPSAFWKIAAIINDETGRLSVTGYLLCQGDLIKGLTGEFVYGAFRAYQVEVNRIGKLARLDVAHLASHDPFARKRRTEGLQGDRESFRTVQGAADLVL